MKVSSKKVYDIRLSACHRQDESRSRWGLAGKGTEGEGGQELSCMVSGRVVAGLAASSPSQLGGAAAAELLLGTLQCGCESRDMEPERVRGRERSEGPQTAEASPPLLPSLSSHAEPSPSAALPSFLRPEGFYVEYSRK